MIRRCLCGNSGLVEFWIAGDTILHVLLKLGLAQLDHSLAQSDFGESVQSLRISLLLLGYLQPAATCNCEVQKVRMRSNFLDLQESVEPSCDLCAFYFFVCKDNIVSTHTNLDEFDFKWEHSGRSWFSFSLFWDHYRTAMAHMMLFEQGCHSHYFSNVPYSWLKRLMGLLRLRQELDVGRTSRVPLRTFMNFLCWPFSEQFWRHFGFTSQDSPDLCSMESLSYTSFVHYSALAFLTKAEPLPSMQSMHSVQSMQSLSKSVATDAKRDKDRDIEWNEKLLKMNGKSLLQ